MKLNMFRATPPIIRSLKLHWQPLVLHTWKVVGLLVGGRCQAQCAWQQTCWASYKYGIIKFWYIVASCWIFLYELYYDARIHKHQVDNPPFDPFWQTVVSVTPWRHSLLTVRTVNLKRSVHTASQKNGMILPAENFTLPSVELRYRLKRRSLSLFYVTDWNWLRGMFHKTWTFPALFFSVRWAYCGHFMTASGPH